MTQPYPSYDIVLPPDLNHAIMAILSFHTTSRNPASLSRICSSLKDFKVTQDQLRDRIQQLRRTGRLIGSPHADNDSYFLITTPQDLEDYLTREYLVKMREMLATVESMIKSASRRFHFSSIKSKLF